MAANHRFGRFIFAAFVGLVVAVLSYRWITDPGPRLERQLQESAVLSARSHLQAVLGMELEIVDPLAVDRKVGKSYVYREAAGWQVSGYYRRDVGDEWHPFLMSLSSDTELMHLKVQDDGLRGISNPLVDVVP